MTVTYHGIAAPVGPEWRPVNGARGRQRDPNVRIEYGVVHLWVSPEDGPERYLRHLRTPQLPAPNTRTFQSRNPAGRWYWETPQGTKTTDETKAKRYTGRACTIYRSDAVPYPLTPGVSPMPWCYGAGYQCIAGIDGEFHFAANPDVHTTNANPPWNDLAVSVCIPGRLQSDAQWQDATSSGELLALAKLMVHAKARWGIPIRYVDARAIKAGLRGWCGHVDVNDVYRRSDHGDPGRNFPWARVIALALQLDQGDDMATLVKVDDPADLALFEASGSTWRWIPDWATLGKLQGDGLVGTELRRVPRANLAGYRLVGADPASVFPQYSTTTGAQFAAHDPAA